MNGMTIKEMDKVIYPVCSLCRDHQRVGFVEGVKIGLLLAGEVMVDASSDLETAPDCNEAGHHR